MKRRITLSIALILSLTLVSLTSSDSTAQAQNQIWNANTGLITLGEGQDLRVTVAGQSGDDAVIVRFRQTRYMQTACDGGICKHAAAAQTLSNPVALAPGEAASMDVYQTIQYSGVRAVVLSNNKYVQVRASVYTLQNVLVSSFKLDVSNGS
jgi:hypothetical protein